MAYKIKQKTRHESEQLPIYKIKGKFYFRDERLGEYRNIKNPSDSLRINNVPNSELQTPTISDRKKIWSTR